MLATFVLPGTPSCRMCNQICHEVHKFLCQISYALFWNILPKYDFPLNFMITSPAANVLLDDIVLKILNLECQIFV
jgi:hypothetical protein